jgi:ActR/RegA family two-component response regulator
MSSPTAPRARLLLVDDDHANLKTFIRAFRDRYDIVPAASVEEALQVLARETVDVAFVDYSMPGRNGLELLRLMQEAHPSVKRVMLTGYGDLPELVAAVGAGLAMKLLMKPWERRDVDDVIANVMRLPR